MKGSRKNILEHFVMELGCSNCPGICQAESQHKRDVRSTVSWPRERATYVRCKQVFPESLEDKGRGQKGGEGKWLGGSAGRNDCGQTVNHHEWCERTREPVCT